MNDKSSYHYACWTTNQNLLAWKTSVLYSQIINWKDCQGVYQMIGIFTIPRAYLNVYTINISFTTLGIWNYFLNYWY